MKEKKIFIGFIIITVLLVVIVSVVLYLNEKQVKKTNININNNTNGQYIQFIEYLIVDKNGGFEIKGWMIPATEDITEANEHIVIRNKKTGESFVIPTMIEQRPDIQQLYPNREVLNCGFAAHLDGSELSIDPKDYDFYMYNESHQKKELVKLDIDNSMMSTN